MLHEQQEGRGMARDEVADLNPWAWYQEAMAGRAPPIHPDKPQCGFFRKRRGKDGPWQPVVIRPSDDDASRLIAYVGDEQVDPGKIWTWVADKPVSQDDAQTAAETGRWPGDIDDAKASVQEATAQPQAAPTVANEAASTNGSTAPIGHNQGPPLLLVELANAVEAAKAFSRANTPRGATLPVLATEVLANQGANHAGKIAEIAGRVEATREELVRPHLDAQRKLNRIWKDPQDDAKIVSSVLNVAAKAFAAAENKRRQDKIKTEREAEERRLREAQERQIAEARAAAEAARKEAEAQGQAELARAHEMDSLLAEEAVLSVPNLPLPEAAPVMLGGQFGKRVGAGGGTRQKYDYHVTDYKAALRHFAEHESVRALVTKLALQAAKAGGLVPGVTATPK